MTYSAFCALLSPLFLLHSLKPFDFSQTNDGRTVSTENTQEFLIGQWQVSRLKGTVRAGDKEVKVTPRSMDVLYYLSQNQGEVVSHNELLEKLWHGTYTSDHAVHKAIAELRRALGDSAQKPSYIKTIPKRGYTLIATVEDAGLRPPATAAQSQDSRQHSPGKATVAQSHIIFRDWRISSAALTLLIIALLFWLPKQNSTQEEQMARLSVLPFTSLGLEEDKQFLIDGLHDSLVNGLSKLSHLQLYTPTSRSNASRSGASESDLSNIDHVLQGSLQSYEDQLRLTIQLTRTADGIHQYSEQFNLEIDDLFGLQDQIVSNIVNALAIHLDESERSQMLDWGTTNATAYERFLRGDFHYNQFSPADFRRSIDYHLAAIEFDPSFINAYLGVATAANNLAVYSSSDTIEELIAIVNTMHREVARIAPNSPVLTSIQEMQLRMGGVNQMLQEQQLRQLILAGNPPEFAVAHYSLFLIGARLYDEAAQILDNAEEVGQFELSPDEVWSYRNQVHPPHIRLASGKGQLQERPYHIGYLGSVATHLALEGNFQEAKIFLERQRDVDEDGLLNHYAGAIVGFLSGEIKIGNEAYMEFMAAGEDFNYGKGALSFMLEDIESGINYWREIPPLQMRRLSNATHHIENFFPAWVLDDPRYAAALEELNVGKTWQHTLMEGVMAMEQVLGVTLSQKAMTAYEANELMVRNDYWTDEQWEQLEAKKNAVQLSPYQLD